MIYQRPKWIRDFAVILVFWDGFHDCKRAMSVLSSNLYPPGQQTAAHPHYAIKNPIVTKKSKQCCQLFNHNKKDSNISKRKCNSSNPSATKKSHACNKPN